MYISELGSVRCLIYNIGEKDQFAEGSGASFRRHNFARQF